MGETSTLFGTVGNKDRLVHRVADEIQRAIVGGRLQPGTMLPPERELAEQVGVSRTVVREAVHILVTKGLLEARQGVGTVVRPLNAAGVAEALEILLQACSITLDDLHHVRLILEVEIAGLAAEQSSPGDVARLEEIVQAMQGAAHDAQTYGAADAEFHQALAQIAGNPLLVMLLGSIRDVLDRVRIEVHRHPRLHEIVLPDHRRIVAQIAAHDVEGARAAIRAHLEHARRIQEEVLTQQGLDTFEGGTHESDDAIR
jgi:GntR family transcriptional repressor for pyruvate dehydrogenase complex